jgi:RNA polymerase sigma-70 factor, ECF subfamily
LDDKAANLLADAAPISAPPGRERANGASSQEQIRSWADGEAERWIVAIAQDQDRGAFASLFIRFAPKLKTYLLRCGVSEQLAEEVAQETLLAVWRKAGQFDPSRASASAWIYAIARNLRVDLARRERTRVLPRAPEPSVQFETPEHHLNAAEGEQRVRKAIEGLPGAEAEVLRLSYFEELSHAQIAQRLSLALGTVKSRIRRATANLRTALDDLA